MPQAVQNKALVDADDVNSAPISPVFWCNNALISPQELCSQSLSLLFPPTNFHEKRCPARIRSYFPRLVANNAPISPGLFGSIRDNALISPSLGPSKKRFRSYFPRILFSTHIPTLLINTYPFKKGISLLLPPTLDSSLQ
jgi:hypothetical protein